jgi:hypothetical protein
MSQYDTYQNLIDFIKNDLSTWEKRLTDEPIVVKPKKHPIYPIYKLKYNQFSSDFSNPIVRCCRGSVVEVDGDSVKMVQMPYYKFVNRGEGESRGEDKINFEKAWVCDKIDGSLIIFSRYRGERLWTTSGSFETTVETPDVGVTDRSIEPETLHLKTFQGLVDYSVKQVEYFDKDGNDWPERIPEGWTIMFELLSPRNRIICKYNKTELVLHGARKPSGEEVSAEKVKSKFDLPFRVVERTPVSSWEDVEKILAEQYTSGINKEGVVVLDSLWNRVKVKSSAYLALKYVKGENNWSQKEIYSCILEGTEDDVIASWPEVTPYIDEIKDTIKKVSDHILNVVTIGKKKLDELNGDIKSFAMWVKEQPQYQQRYLFFVKKPNYEDFVKSTLKDLRWDEVEDLSKSLNETMV